MGPSDLASYAAPGLLLLAAASITPLKVVTYRPMPLRKSARNETRAVGVLGAEKMKKCAWVHTEVAAASSCSIFTPTREPCWADCHCRPPRRRRSYALPFLVVLSSQFSNIFPPRRRSVALFQFELVYRRGGTIERRPGANRFEKQRTTSAIRAIHAGASPCGEYRHEAPTLCVLL